MSVLLAVLLLVWPPAGVRADSFDEDPPVWEPLLRGGRINQEGDSSLQAKPSPDGSDHPVESVGSTESPTGNAKREAAASGSGDGPAPAVPRVEVRPVHAPRHLAGTYPSMISSRMSDLPPMYSRDPFSALLLRNIDPLYTSPALPGEGIWDSSTMPTDRNGWPVVYRTSYRPSVEYPNAIAHMLLFDMRRVHMRLYIGSSEPGAPKDSSEVEPDMIPRLLCITNALWKQKHARGAGAIFRGKVLRPMVPGMATLVSYKDHSVDILEWNDGIPVSMVEDARQLRHLIVNDGRVVDTVIKGGQRVDSEIGLGFLLSEDSQPGYAYGWGGYYWNQGPRHTYGEDWFIATRSAFGIRRDGNLVFAVGHHISTKDLARALVLAGCVRAIHGDANPHNVLGNIYQVGTDGQIVSKAKLSPDQKDYTLNRYVKNSYTSDFYGFFRKPVGKESL